MRTNFHTTKGAFAKKLLVFRPKSAQYRLRLGQLISMTPS
jgi:hypothetical protein